jgi:hypothetical protein|tara:strand:- start:1827 stop:2465 length:639 start_codon:yes stop_codon:yes gene_type:complete
MRRDRYKTSIAFIDLLFNITIGLAMLFIIAFLLINPVAKKGDIIVKAEFIVTMSWPADRHDDIDLYLKDPADNYVFFKQKDKGLNNLDRDDLGSSNDVVKTVSGDVFFRLNEEHITIREVLPGQYIVNAHWYSKSNVTKQLPTGEVYEPSVTVPVTVKIEKLNPYQLVYVGTKTLDFQGAEATFLRFTLDDEGNVVETNDLPFKMANTTGTR